MHSGKLKTPVYHDLNELEISLGALRAETAARAAELGIGLLASSSTHPHMPRGHMMLRNGTPDTTARVLSIVS